MCDEIDLARMKGRGVSRREFAAIGAAGAMATLAASTAAYGQASGLSEEMVRIPIGSGTMDAFFVHPAEGEHPAIIVWPDIAGLRPTFQMMARQLASAGYSVLVANPFYRDEPAPQFSDFGDFRDGNGFERVGPWREKLTAEAITQDARALVSWLDAQDAVNTADGIGTQGYCMGGPFTVWTAAAVPDRVSAAASFHGGGLVGDGEMAPINLLDDTDAHFLFAIAENDDERSPDEKDALRAAADAANVEAEIEVYPADHGWTVADSPAYDQAAADRAQTRLLALYEAAL